MAFRTCLLIFFTCLFSYDGKAQIKFIKNEGQWNKAVSYKADIHSGSLYLMPGELRYHFNNITEVLHHPKEVYKTETKGHVIFLEWQGANKTDKYNPEGQLPEYYNYFISRDRSRWKGGVKAYSSLNSQNLYPGIDMLMESLGSAIKLTYHVAPGSDPAQIKVKITGADDVYVKEDKLHIDNTVNNITEDKPYAYQLINGLETEVKCFYKLIGNVVTFDLPEGYDKTKPLVIDPTLIFATYSGSVADNFGFTATYDSAGNAYGGGTVYDYNFPTTTGAYQKTWANGVFDSLTISDIERDAGILKFSPDGKKLLWATYLGGSGNEQPHSMIVDSNDRLVVFGTTHSYDFPVSKGAYDTTLNGLTDIFVTKFSPDGTKIIASTFVGGSGADGLNGLVDVNENIVSSLYANYGDQFRGEVIVDPDNSVYVASATKSNDFPVSSNAFQKTFGGSLDGVVFKLDSSFTKLLFSTYIGSSKDDAAYSLKVDKNKQVFVCGGTSSSYFLPDLTTFQKTLAGGVDGFIVHLKNDGSAVINSTFIGTAKYDQTFFVQLDKNENVYVYGQTNADSFPIKNVKYYTKKASQFVSCFANDLQTLSYSSTFGSGKTGLDISPTAFLVDDCNKIYISGWGPNKSMPLTSDAFQKASQKDNDFYIAVFAKGFDTLLYGSYFGGPQSNDHVDGGTSRFDKKGIIYQSICAGCGGYSDFPTTTGAWSQTNKGKRPGSSLGGCNNLVMKIDLDVPDLVADFDIPYEYWCLTVAPSIVNKSKRADSYLWMFGDGATSTAKTPVHTYKDTGTYTISLVVTNFASCAVYDTMKKVIHLYDHPDPEIILKRDGCTNNFTMDAKGDGKDFKWTFSDSISHTFTGNIIQRSFKEPGKYTLTLTTDSGTSCADTLSRTIVVNFPYADFTFKFDSCRPAVKLLNKSPSPDSFVWVVNSTDVLIGANPEYIFKDSDTSIDVRLYVYDSAGCSVQQAKTLKPPGYLKAGFTFQNDTCKGIVTFNNASTLADSFTWHFGDGTTSSLKDPPPKTFAKDSSYKIRLIAYTKSGCKDTAEVVIGYKTSPKAEFTFLRDSCSGRIYFTNHSWGASANKWDFGDSTSSMDANPVHKYQNGEYKATLTINEGTACEDTFSLTVIMKDRPQGGFLQYPDSCSFKVQFEDKSFGADSVLWIFGDGASSKSTDPVHDYTKAGTWLVMQVVNPGDACADTFPRSVTVEPLPQAMFDYSQAQCSYMVSFTNNSFRNYTSHWDFGDGNTDVADNPVHNYTKAGIYTVRLLLNQGLECADTLEKSVTIEETPKAKFAYFIDTCTFRVQFVDSSNKAGKWSWDFGDGNIDSIQNPLHVYAAEGSYTVNLVINFEGCKDTFSKTISLGEKPLANFGYIVDSCSQHVRFFDSSFQAVNVRWDFGDGQTSTERNPEIDYKTGGNKSVKLIINPGTTCSDSITEFIYVTPFPKADFTYIMDTCYPYVVFNNTSSGAKNVYWDFGDGTSSSEYNPVHYFENHSSNKVTLTINPGSGCIEKVEKTIETDYRSAGFKTEVDSCLGIVHFINNSEYAGTYKWDFGDGATSTKKEPAHSYTAGGEFRIRLIINPGTDCADTAYLPYTHTPDEATEIKIPNVFTPNNDGFNDRFDISAPVFCGDYDLLVFNRWGELVFEQRGRRISWDGTYIKNGRELPEGTYYYIFRSQYQEEIKGTVNILR